MWIGEEDVEAAIILSIDDLGFNQPTAPYTQSPAAFEEYLRPIIDRLKQIDPQAGASIFACETDTETPLLQTFLQEKLSIEAHTADHPVPFFKQEEPVHPTVKETLINQVFDSVANINRIPGHTAVAFRMPGCDARNTVSPRLFTEILNQKSRAGDGLQIDSSIFMLYTEADPDLKKRWLIDRNGHKRFEKFLTCIPWCNHYVNYIANYPYPYVVAGQVWEFPVTIPGDAHGILFYKKKSPDTVEDWKAALDATVHKQGLMTICFHPKHFIWASQIVDLIDYAHKTYGARVKFLSYAQALERINTHALGGPPLKTKNHSDNGVRLLDVNADGFMDVIVANQQKQETRVWRPSEKKWDASPFPTTLTTSKPGSDHYIPRERFFTATTNGYAGVLVADQNESQLWRFNGQHWLPDLQAWPVMINDQPIFTLRQGRDGGVRFRDVNGDQLSDLIVNNETQNTIFLWNPSQHQWTPASFSLPAHSCIVDKQGRDAGLRFADINRDGHDDLVLSNEQSTWVHLFDSTTPGWHREIEHAAHTIPPITREGKLNGVWFREDEMILLNEKTWKYSNLIHRVNWQQTLPDLFTPSSDRNH